MGFLIVCALGLAILFWFVPPFGVPADYHLFIDPTGDILSSFLISLAGVWGWRRSSSFWWQLLFVCAVASGIASVYYHLAPDPARLRVDQMPIALGFAAFSVALADEGRGWGWKFGAPMLLLAFASVWLSDLRLYAWVQGVPYVAVPWFAPRRTWLWTALGCYAAAKGCELADARIYHAFGEALSGHTLKHVLAALGVAAVSMGVRKSARGGQTRQ